MDLLIPAVDGRPQCRVFGCPPDHACAGDFGHLFAGRAHRANDRERVKTLQFPVVVEELFPDLSNIGLLESMIEIVLRVEGHDSIEIAPLHGLLCLLKRRQELLQRV